MSRAAARKAVASILSSVPSTSSRPLALDILSQTVSEVLATLEPKPTPAQWDNAMRTDILQLVAQRLTMEESLYWSELFDRLDLIIAFEHQGAVSDGASIHALSDLFQVHTIPSCVRLFEWLEFRTGSLTKGMIPSKSKSLSILRMLNDLGRRTSKTGSTATFNGRILNYLSSVLPLGERSGVNLRGEYGPPWVPVESPEVPSPENELSQSPIVASEKPEADSNAMEDVKPTSPNPPTVTPDASASTDPPTNPSSTNASATAPSTDTPTAPSSTSEKPPSRAIAIVSPEIKAAREHAELYQTFWSIQTFMSRPIEFNSAGRMEIFVESVDKILPVLFEATKKERASQGNKANRLNGNGLSSTATSSSNTTAGTKRKRDGESPDAQNEGASASSVGQDYFFAKFLTSPELLTLELADIHFRRQILTQILILLNYLQIFQPDQKAKWENNKNRSLWMPFFTLEGARLKWVKETYAKIMEDLRAGGSTVGGGGVSAQQSIAALLEREQAWVRWKQDLCPTFEKPPLEPSELEEGIVKRRKLVSPIEPLAESHGTSDLAEIWETGYKGLDDLADTPRHTSFERYVRDLSALDKTIDKKRKQLVMAAARKKPFPAPKPVPAPAEPIPVVAAPPPTPASIPTPAPVPAKPLPHGLPPKPGSVPVLLGLPPNPTPRASTSPAPSVAPAAPVEKPAPSPAPEKEELTDWQLEMFIEQRQILIWRALRMADQEGLLQLTNTSIKSAAQEAQIKLTDLAGLLEYAKAKRAQLAGGANVKEANGSSVAQVDGASVNGASAVPVEEVTPVEAVPAEDGNDGVKEEPSSTSPTVMDVDGVLREKEEVEPTPAVAGNEAVIVGVGDGSKQEEVRSKPEEEETMTNGVTLTKEEDMNGTDEGAMDIDEKPVVESSV